MSKNWPRDRSLINNDYIPLGESDDCYVKQEMLNFMAIDITKKIMLSSGSHMNDFLNERVLPNSNYTTIVRPNVDTLYSQAWLDLSQQPVVLYVPATHNRYYLMEFLDAWTNVFASIGARTTGTAAGAYAIAGPQWNGMLPEGIMRVDAPTNTVWVIGRTQTNGPSDYSTVHAIQDRYA